MAGEGQSTKPMTQISKQMVYELPPLETHKPTTLKSSHQGLGKKMELMRSLRDIEKKGRLEKMTV